MNQILLTVFLVVSPDSVPTHKAVEFTKSGIKIFASIGIKIRLRGVQKIRAKRAERWHRLRWIRKELAVYAKRYSSPKGLSYVMVPPYLKDSILYLAGIANGRCTIGKGSIALGVAELVNQAGEHRERHSVIVLVHELGHCLSMSHLDVFEGQESNLIDCSKHCSIMCADALRCMGDKDLQFNNISKREAHRCLRSLN